MLTSFAPSPIAKVVFWGNLFFIIFTMSAFCFGETLQANTTSTESEAFKNMSLISSLESINKRDAPATIIAYFLLFFDYKVLILRFSKISSIFFYNEFGSTSSIMWLSISWSNNPAETPIFIAVSILSPVRTQTLIPAFFINWIESATWS